MKQQPTIGSIVLFHERPSSDGPQFHGRTRPAIVTSVSDDGTVGLLIFTARSENAMSADDGHWTWPEVAAPEPAAAEMPKATAKPKTTRKR